MILGEARELMVTEEILDFEALLAPISEENPAGEDLREDFSPESLFYLFKDLRSNARAEERNHVPDSESSEIPGYDHWRKLMKSVPKAIAKTSKDLDFAVWLTEALVRLHGFEGLHQGLQLMNGLIETFWDTLHPMPDEDGIETRLGSLSGFAPAISQSVNCIPLFKSAEGKDYSNWSYQQAIDVEKLTDPSSKNHRISSGAAILSEVELAAKRKPEEELRELLGIVADSQAQLQQLDKQLDTLCQARNEDNPVILAELRNTLESINFTVNKFIPEPVLEVEQLEDTSDNRDNIANDGLSFNANSLISNRQNAFDTLAQVAEFFRNTEPHSPISYAIEKIVNWGNMSLPELVNELILDGNAKQDYCRLAGIAPVMPQQAQHPNDGMHGMGMPHGPDFGGGPGGDFSMGSPPGMPSSPDFGGGMPPPMFNNNL